MDGSGTIEFDEYVRVMATYCMFTKDEILRFCFECFDVDKSGTIDEKEFVELCKYVPHADLHMKIIVCFHIRCLCSQRISIRNFLFVVIVFLLCAGVSTTRRRRFRATSRRLWRSST